MSFSWKELVCHGLLKKVGDPSLVKEILKVVMKERWLFLEEEAREFHTGIIGPVVDVYRDEWRFWGHRQPSDQCFHAIAGYEERHARLKRRSASRAELWRTAIRYKNLKKELLSSWEKRMPRKRKDSILIAIGEKGWEPEDGLLNLLSDDGVLLREQKYIAKCQWYQGIHEGRYYLFWHKDSFIQASHFTHWSVTASIDINVIEGRTQDNPWGSQAYPDICWDPKYLREKTKERKHIDDMFH